MNRTYQYFLTKPSNDILSKSWFHNLTSIEKNSKDFTNIKDIENQTIHLAFTSQRPLIL